MTETAFDPPPRPARRRVSVALLAMIVVTLVGLGLAGYGFVSMLGYQRLVYPGGAMGATFAKSTVLLAKDVKDAAEYRRGDIVVVDLGALTGQPGADQGLAVTRIVGVAGDMVGCCTDKGHIRLNGTEVVETYATIPSAGQMAFEATVAPDSFFLAGDDRDGAVDSRLFADGPGGGSVKLSALRGRVVATGNVLAPELLEPTAAFAGLGPKSEVDNGLPGLRTLVLLGGIVAAVGVIGVIVFAVRAAGRRRKAAAGPPVR